MTPPDPTTEIAALGIEPTFSAREAAALLGRSFSWLDQRVRRGQFVRPDGAVLTPLRTCGGYRYFTIEMLREIACCCHRHRWYSYEELRSVFRELAIASHRDIGEYKIRG